MTRVELKKKLINKIGSIENDALLEEMLRIAGGESVGEDVYSFTKQELKAVEEAEKEYERGEYISGEDADKIIREWLEK